MGQGDGSSGRPARAIALVGPFQSGKTTLLDALLTRSGARTRQGRVADGTTLGDGSPEARAHAMSVEINAATLDYLGDTFHILDCPGSVELQGEADPVLDAVDAAIVVCEPDEKKIPALQVILKDLTDRGIPHFLFLNKIDKATGRIRDTLALLQPASPRPLVLRQIPIWENGIVTGFIDLALERAHLYREHAPSKVIDLPTALAERETEARFSMLEKLADYDDALMEQLLDDIEPPRDLVFEDLARELQEGHICPVLLGSAENGNGIVRLLKALRHETPSITDTCARLGDEAPRIHVFKTIHTAHAGKLSLGRVMAGQISEGASVETKDGPVRPAGLFSVMGQDVAKRSGASAGDVVGLGRLDDGTTGMTLGLDGSPTQLPSTSSERPTVFGLAISVPDRKDEVKLTGALTKILEEDPTLTLTHDQTAQEIVPAGQGDMHLRLALERLERKYGVSVETHRPKVGHKETIRGSITQRGRHKKQSGGHGQFGDVVIEVAPQERGMGFAFSERISGGVVPKTYFPSVKAGIQDAMVTGPLGFPVVDVATCLIDGSTHSVDSSDQAFRTAGRIAMSEALEQCKPVLLQPMMHVTIFAPSEATARINAIVTGRKGHILGFAPRDGWEAWDVVEAHMPESEIQDLIVDIRSASSGVGTYLARFDHLAELTGREAQRICESAAAEAA